MRQIHSDIIPFRGSHYEFGYMQGQQLKHSLTIKNRTKHWKIRKPRFQINIEEAKAKFMTYAPQMWSEFEGLKDGLEKPMEEVLRDFGGYRVEIDKSGCSVMTDTDYMIRNYDYQPQTYEGRYSLFQPTDQGYATIGPTSRVTGRMDGMNEKGLAMAYNFTHRKKSKDGFVCYMIGRMILDTCANVHEAIQLLKDIPHRNAFSYIVLDPSGQSYVIETSPRGVEVRQTNVCTNHFETMTDENRHHLEDSYKRMEAINNQRSQATDPYKAFRLLNDTDKGIFSKKYKSWAGTIHTSAYFPKERKAWFALGGDQEPVEFDFGAWLKGESIETEQIFGEVDTNIPFAHLD
ncbi:C45 family autoproteolytic acyltransferase/hydolase [Alkalibacillus aidingensis]|uniref:C45 family autoproteolytic acyltransferase/hydolase n=1 Tax=Alkalibacillus aidingensis TaxID=2747607 RepID=UPI0016616A83|nr:C45 family peptidase [Alkalibacillus aidingensis]